MSNTIEEFNPAFEEQKLINFDVKKKKKDL